MRVLPAIDCPHEVRRRIDLIRDCLRYSRAKYLVLGISGGVDSCVCGKLAQLAVESMRDTLSSTHPEFIAVRLPYAAQQDAQDAQRGLRVHPTGSMSGHQHPRPAVDAIDDAGHAGMAVDEPAGTDRRPRRLRQRQHQGARPHDRTVPARRAAGRLGSGNRSFRGNVTGFYTKHGDGACDLAPLFGLNKRQVRSIAGHLGARTGSSGNRPPRIWRAWLPARPMRTPWAYATMTLMISWKDEPCPQRPRNGSWTSIQKPSTRGCRPGPCMIRRRSDPTPTIPLTDSLDTDAMYLKIRMLPCRQMNRAGLLVIYFFYEKLSRNVFFSASSAI